MPTIKVVQLPHQIRQDGTVQILIRLTHNRKVTYCKTGYYVKPSQLKDGKVIKHPDQALLNINIEHKRHELLQTVLKQDGTKEGINLDKATGKETEATDTNTMFNAASGTSCGCMKLRICLLHLTA